MSAILLTVVRKSGDAAGGEAAEGFEAIGTVEEESLEIVKTQFFLLQIIVCEDVFRQVYQERSLLWKRLLH